MKKMSTTLCLLTMAMSAAAAVSDLPKVPPTDLITNPAPQAEREVYVKSGLGLVFVDDEMQALPSDGSLSNVVRDGEEIYINRVFSWKSTEGWIKGEVKDGKAIFHFPQLVDEYTEDVGGILEVRKSYAVVCQMKQISVTQADMVPTPAQEYSFILNEDGSMTPEDPELFICNWEYSDYVWDWVLDGDSYISLSPQTAETAATPSDLTFTPMILTYPHVIYGGKYAESVGVAFNDNDCYIKGIALGISDLKDAVIKGSVNNNVISFPTDQFLGDSWKFGFTQYFIAGETSYVEDAEYGYLPMFEPTEMMEFVYDRESDTMFSDMSFIIAPSPQDNPENLYYENIYNTPEIFYADPVGEIKSIAAPEVISFVPGDGTYPDIIRMIGSMISDNYVLLDLDRLYFEIYADGEPFVFTPSMDSALKHPTSLIPMGSNDYICFVTQDKIVQLVALPQADYSSLSVRFVYDPDGENPVYSDFSRILGTAVDSLQDEAQHTIGYLDPTGFKTLKPRRGINIRITTSPDGSIRYEKVLIK